MKKQTISTAGGEKYYIEDILGTGGMGVVYLARDLICGRPIALKLVSQQDIRSESISRLVREARLTADLEHPNIIPVHELGQDTNGSFYYTMKCVNGITLADILIALRKGNQEIIRDYPLEKLLTVFLKVCDAVSFAHSRGIIHQDLKPSNIMVGGFGEVVVLDWGLARYLHGGAKSGKPINSSTSPGACPLPDWASGIFSDTTTLKRDSVEGTPGFIAPELLDASFGAVDELSDIYALGGLLYSILALKPAVSGEDVGEMIRRIVEGDITPPEDVPLQESEVKHIMHHCRDGRIPPELSDMVMKAMSLKKEFRYQNVREFQQDIECYQQGMVWHLIYEMPQNDLEATLHWEVAGGTLR
ncbi:MAG: serine/threonine-protein kinase, partial [Kiritimatiellae bacterium]|nr:serine/threonine-protein kinase [Kiritimatiellia bacterium]